MKCRFALVKGSHILETGAFCKLRFISKYTDYSLLSIQYFINTSIDFTNINTYDNSKQLIDKKLTKE